MDSESQHRLFLLFQKLSHLLLQLLSLVWVIPLCDGLEHGLLVLFQFCDGGHGTDALG